MPQTISLTTLGCAKNLSDSENMLGLLHSSGFQITTSPSQADICIVNTCTFISESTNQSLDTLIDLGDQGKKLIITGCLAQRYKEELFKEIPQVKAVLGTGDIEEIVGAVHWVAKNEEPKSFFGAKKGYVAPSAVPRIRLSGGISAYVKISEGCNHRCSFCIIPSLRGQLKSRPIEDIVKEVQELSDSGVQEVILISQDSTAYGIDLYKGQWKLAELLDRIATETNIPWVRLMYSYPGEVTDEMLQVMASHKALLKYIDIPLQHSHPETLKRMKRPVSSEATILKIKAAIPEVAIRTTFIVGFPGETEEEFQDLYKFIETQKFDRVGVFTYSKEDTTHGATLENQVPEKIKKQRQKALMQLQEGISLAKNQALIGTTQDVLIEKVINDSLVGRTYRDAPEIDGKVLIKTGTSKINPENLIGKFLKCKIESVNSYDLFAEEFEVI
ncbi:MAG: 30S ribosomal protein S12 methylthiotransferase RimO [Candidatus Caenarcaniphilales bacterium]|nr:30S ribosomal protein S12 methylthiotransferase RimO [Candidatus Caenarcaniphilales bacterium]